MIAFQILAAGLALADPLPTGLDQIAAPPPPVTQAPPPANCLVEFETTLVDLKPEASTLELGEKLKLVLTREPQPSASALREGDVEIGFIRTDPNLKTLLDCGAAGHNYQAESIAGVYRVRVAIYPEG